MNKTTKLKTSYFTLIAIALGMVVCFETDILAEGALFGTSHSVEFLVTTFMELLTIATIPLSLRFVRRDKWRILLIMVPMVVNTLLYYLYMSVPFGYLAIILLIASVFVYPKKKPTK